MLDFEHICRSTDMPAILVLKMQIDFFLFIYLFIFAVMRREELVVKSAFKLLDSVPCFPMRICYEECIFRQTILAILK